MMETHGYEKLSGQVNRTCVLWVKCSLDSSSGTSDTVRNKALNPRRNRRWSEESFVMTMLTLLTFIAEVASR